MSFFLRTSPNTTLFGIAIHSDVHVHGIATHCLHDVVPCRAEKLALPCCRKMGEFDKRTSIPLEIVLVISFRDRTPH